MTFDEKITVVDNSLWNKYMGTQKDFSRHIQGGVGQLQIDIPEIVLRSPRQPSLAQICQDIMELGGEGVLNKLKLNSDGSPIGYSVVCKTIEIRKNWKAALETMQFTEIGQGISWHLTESDIVTLAHLHKAGIYQLTIEALLPQVKMREAFRRGDYSGVLGDSIKQSDLPSWVFEKNGSVITMGSFWQIDQGGSETIMRRPKLPYKNGDVENYQRNYQYRLSDSYGYPLLYDLTWIKLTDTTLVCDRCLLSNISWTDICQPAAFANNGICCLGSTSANGTVSIDGYRYDVRLMYGGQYKGKAPTIWHTSALSSEWNELVRLCNGDDDKMHWRGMYTLCAETNAFGELVSVPMRGCDDPNGWVYGAKNNNNVTYGYRPVLELIK